MSRILNLSTALLCFIFFGFTGLVYANEMPISSDVNSRQQCNGMYGRRDWGGNIDPYIEVLLRTPANAAKADDGTVGIVIFEWEDIDKIGIEVPEGSNEDNKVYVCDESAISKNLCTKEQYGEFLLEGTADGNISSAYTKAITLSSVQQDPIKYQVHRTGFYCVGTYATSEDFSYEGVVTFQNAFGKLPASQIAKLPFYGGTAIAYSVVLAFWMFLYVQYRSDILAVQNYITACVAFLAIEMLIVWGYYDLVNRSGNTVFSRIYMVTVSILNAFRNAFTFFLLLIVCMGYGVVKPSLGSTMTKCRILAGLHFLFGILYAVATFMVTPDTAGLLILLVTLPLATTMNIFYLWILNSLTKTIRELKERKQNVKALMYNRLFWLLMTSIIVIFAFFFFSSITFADRNSRDFIPLHWKSRWFVLDGWMNVVYFVDFVLIAFLWRPTANNRRFAMSDELAQDEDGEGFEIASLAGSLADEEAIPSHGYDPVNTTVNSGSANPYGRDSIDNDSLAGSVVHPESNPYGNGGSSVNVNPDSKNNGVENETMFEAPDDEYDRWSEDDDDHPEYNDNIESARLNKDSSKDD
ncbi:lung seven transmembrane receptor-domain-containing protein [Dipodascopsis uninucleata]